MNTNNELEEFYSKLENLSSLDYWETLKQILPLNEILEGELLEKLKVERKVLSFFINNGNFSPIIKNTDVNGNVNQYPKFSDFSESDLEYLKFRLGQIKNPWLICRYSVVLYSVTKHNSFVKIALDSYLSCLDIIIEKQDNENYNQIDDLVNCLLKFYVKSYQQTIKSKVIEIIKFKEIPSYIRFYVLEIAFGSKYFKPIDLNFALDLCVDWIDLKSNGNFFLNSSILNFAIKLAGKLNRPCKIYYSLLAENQNLIINEHPDEDDFIRFTCFGEKARYYKLAGETQKYKKALKEYTKLKTKVKLNHFESRFSPEHELLLNNYLNKKSEVILKWQSFEILHYFATADDILIEKEFLDHLTENGVKNSFLGMVSESTFDINVNYKKTTTNQQKQNERFRNYSMHFNLFVYPLIFKVFASGIINGKLNYNSVFEYLKSKSWYGQKFELAMVDRDIDKKSNWLSLFAPGLHSFLSQVEWAVIMRDNDIPNYILSLDSLTLKFEGALRDFIRLLGGSTTTEKRGVLQEQLLEELIVNPKIIEKFSDKDISLFRYTFTGDGWNIRNNIAHCFYPYSNYSFEKVVLVFLCILRLGKYILKAKE